MFGNFPVNDDWIFVRQIEAFNALIFKLSAQLDPSFISQGLLGLLWGQIFGISFTSLKLLTLVITLLATVGFYKILCEYSIAKRVRIFSTLLFFFNPLIFISAYTFMTDNYFLFFLIWTLYFYLKYLKNENTKYLYCGVIFSVLAALTRHIGIILNIALIISLLFDDKRKHKKVIILSALGTVIPLLIIYFWPRFGIQRTYILSENLAERIRYLSLSILYFPLFLFPFAPGIRIEWNKLNKILLVIGSAAFSYYFYFYDFFPLGNVFYLEALYTKSDFRSNFSLFDNVFFKVFFAIFLGICVSKILLYIYLKGKILKQLNQVKEVRLLLSLSVLMFGTLFISSDIYDRYLIPVFVPFLVIFLGYLAKDIKISRISWVLLIFFSFIVISLQYQFATETNLKWLIAKNIQKDKNLVNQIYLNDTYINYAVTMQNNDFTGLIERKLSYEPQCFIQAYTLDNKTSIFRKIEKLDEHISNKYLSKPEPYNSHKKKDIPRIKNHLNELEYNYEYFSILYNVVGKKAFVGSFCVDINND